MLTRRAFLKTTLAASATLSSTALLALQSRQQNLSDAPFLIFADETNAQAATFSSALASTPSYIHRDVTAQLAEVESFCKEQPKGVLFGLTRDSDFMVLEQAAMGHGFSVHYKGIHDFRNTQMRHQVQAPQSFARTLASAMQEAQYDWPRQLANAAPLIAAMHSKNATDQSVEEALVSLEYRNGDPGYLVSWMMKIS